MPSNTIEFPLAETGVNMPELFFQIERTLILQALARCNGVKAQAAKLLGINRSTLVEKMRRHDMPLNPSTSRVLLKQAAAC